MSQENVEIIRRLWLAYVRQDYEASIAALDDAVELSSDPRANMETGLVRGREAVVASIGGFILSFDDYWCEEPEELIDVGDWVIVVVRSGGRGRTSGVPSRKCGPLPTSCAAAGSFGSSSIRTREKRWRPSKPPG